MIKLGVIGIGHIFQKQIEVLNHFTDKYQLIAICDSNQDRLESCGLHNIPKYTNYKDMISNKNIDSILISTPPSTHYQIAKDALISHKNVLLEKPAVLEIEQLTELYNIAEEYNSLLHIAFHASFAKDLQWFLSNQSTLFPHQIKKITCSFYDPYMTDGVIQKERIPLGGCYIDSGVNALSVCQKLVSLKDFHLAERIERRDINNVTYEAKYLFGSGECDIIINTAWNKGLNLKKTVIKFKDMSDIVELNHSQQEVILITNNERKTLFSFKDTERLFTHYCGVFNDFFNAVETGTVNKFAYDIHRLLLLN